MRTGDLKPHLSTVEERAGIASWSWSETALNRLASALLKTAVDFPLKDRDVKESGSGRDALPGAVRAAPVQDEQDDCARDQQEPRRRLGRCYRRRCHSKMIKGEKIRG